MHFSSKLEIMQLEFQNKMVVNLVRYRVRGTVINLWPYKQQQLAERLSCCSAKLNDWFKQSVIILIQSGQ